MSIKSIKYSQRKINYADYTFYRYNNLDVQPFLEAIEKQSQIYEQREMDMFKDAVSIPGISVKWKFFDLKDDNSVGISLICTQNKDLTTQ